MRIWTEEEAGARLEEVVALCQEGPQLISQKGKAVAVMVSVAEWERLSGAQVGKGPTLTLKEWLLLEHPRWDFDLPGRSKKGRLKSKRES